MNIDEILSKVPDKKTEWMTTSKTLKRNVYEFFNRPYFNRKVAVEFGCFHGQTSFVLANIFKHVHCFDIWTDALEHARKFLRENGVSNCSLYQKDLYDGTPLPVNAADVIFIDSKHDYDGVKSDIETFRKFKSEGQKYFILDDYGVCKGIRECVKEYVDKRVLRVQTYIGSTPKDYHPVKLSDREGVILIEV